MTWLRKNNPHFVRGANAADRLKKSHEEHDAIVNAMLSGDAKTASQVMRSHVSVVRAASSDYVHELEAAAAVTDLCASEFNQPRRMPA
jgi:DNA-binding FadR family transcriptional regulator